jgi:hypothetical protein
MGFIEIGLRSAEIPVNLLVDFFKKQKIVLHRLL